MGQVAKNLEAWVNIDIMHTSKHSRRPLMLSNTVTRFMPLVETVGTTEVGGGGTYGVVFEGPASGGANCGGAYCGACFGASFCSRNNGKPTVKLSEKSTRNLHIRQVHSSRTSRNECCDTFRPSQATKEITVEAKWWRFSNGGRHTV